MFTEKHSLQSFLRKMTSLSAKGWILHLDFCEFDSQLYVQKSNLLNELLYDLQKNKAFVILENENAKQFFLYFQENKDEDIQPLLIKIQFLFGLSLQESAISVQTFYHVYHLSEDLQNLRQKFAKPDISVGGKLNFLANCHNTAKETALLTLDLFQQLEKDVSQIDLSSWMRRQSVCAIVGKGRPVELFDEVYVSLSDLQKALCQNVSVNDSPYLKNKLLETLDKRVLEHISHHDGGAFRKNFSLNLSVRTLLSPDFERFNANIEDNVKSTVILEIRMDDVLTDADMFIRAKEYVLNAGYQLCIDLPMIDLLPLWNKHKMAISFIKLPWCEDLPVRACKKTLLDALHHNENADIILSGVDTPKAIEWGQQNSINLFQGFYVQKFLYQMPKPRKN